MFIAVGTAPPIADDSTIGAQLTTRECGVGLPNSIDAPRVARHEPHEIHRGADTVLHGFRADIVQYDQKPLDNCPIEVSPSRWRGDSLIPVSEPYPRDPS